ncbi:MAG: hypothetical protein NTV24_00190 [Candidatus Woesebacteria bacterium]|nr:hypothetical protein [Candidatus Woesebacteria bacterium]
MFNLNLGKFSFSPSYIQVGAILLLLFILVLSLAQLRRHFVDWSFKGAVFGIFFGFLLALILEGFLIIGGKTVITQVLGWKNAPKPVANLLEIGRDKLIQVLGEQVEIRVSDAVSKLNPTFSDGVTFFQSLNPTEAQKLKNFICKP